MQTVSLRLATRSKDRALAGTRSKRKGRKVSAKLAEKNLCGSLRIVCVLCGLNLSRVRVLYPWLEQGAAVARSPSDSNSPTLRVKLSTRRIFVAIEI